MKYAALGNFGMQVRRVCYWSALSSQLSTTLSCWQTGKGRTQGDGRGGWRASHARHMWSDLVGIHYATCPSGIVRLHNCNNRCIVLL